MVVPSQPQVIVGASWRWRVEELLDMRSTGCYVPAMQKPRSPIKIKFRWLGMLYHYGNNTVIQTQPTPAQITFSITRYTGSDTRSLGTRQQYGQYQMANT